ncbi:hypothetical protein PG984_005344 [Apiospora sp. TS-2023a]
MSNIREVISAGAGNIWGDEDEEEELAVKTEATDDAQQETAAVQQQQRQHQQQQGPRPRVVMPPSGQQQQQQQQQDQGQVQYQPYQQAPLPADQQQVGQGLGTSVAAQCQGLLAQGEQWSHTIESLYRQAVDQFPGGTNSAEAQILVSYRNIVHQYRGMLRDRQTVEALNLAQAATNDARAMSLELDAANARIRQLEQQQKQQAVVPQSNHFAALHEQIQAMRTSLLGEVRPSMDEHLLGGNAQSKKKVEEETGDNMLRFQIATARMLERREQAKEAEKKKKSLPAKPTAGRGGIAAAARSSNPQLTLEGPQGGGVQKAPKRALFGSSFGGSRGGGGSGGVRGGARGGPSGRGGRGGGGPRGGGAGASAGAGAGAGGPRAGGVPRGGGGGFPGGPGAAGHGGQASSSGAYGVGELQAGQGGQMAQAAPSGTATEFSVGSLFPLGGMQSSIHNSDPQRVMPRGGAGQEKPQGQEKPHQKKKPAESEASSVEDDEIVHTDNDDY